MLNVSGLAHRYDGVVSAVNGVDVAVKQGEIVCLLGPSGCGKSTLLRLAAGLEDVQQGEIHIGGERVAHPGRSLPPEARDVGLVFQDYALFPHLDVLGNVVFGLKGTKDGRERALDLLGRVGMADRAGAYPHTLSGGQQQRVALARALAPRPSVMLLDEPFSGLDRALRQEVRDRTLSLLRSTGVASLVVTHDPEEAMFLADRIVLMRDGKIEQEGSPSDLYLRPVTDFAARFFGEVNGITGTVGDDGTVATPFGEIPFEGPAGSPVEIIVRPEALLPVDPDGGEGCTATVTGSRLLGASTLLHLRINRDDGIDLPMISRSPGAHLMKEGARIGVRVAQQGLFIFNKLQ